MPLPPIHGLATTIEVSNKGVESDQKYESHWDESFSWWQESLAEGNEVVDNLIRQIAGSSSKSSNDRHDHLKVPVEHVSPSPAASSRTRNELAAKPVDVLVQEGGTGEESLRQAGSSRSSTTVLQDTHSEASSGFQGAPAHTSPVPDAKAVLGDVPRGSIANTPQENGEQRDAAEASSGPAKRVRGGRGAAAATETARSHSDKVLDTAESEATANEKENLGNRSPVQKRSRRAATTQKKASADTAPTEAMIIDVSRSTEAATLTSASTSASAVSTEDHRAITAEIAELREIPVMSMKVVELRAAVRKLGVSSAGLKAVLQNKLQDAITERLAELEGTLSPPVEQEQQEEGEDKATGTGSDSRANCDEVTSVGDGDAVDTEQANVIPTIDSRTEAAATLAMDTVSNIETAGAPEDVGAQTLLSAMRLSTAPETTSPLRTFSPLLAETGVKAIESSPAAVEAEETPSASGTDAEGACAGPAEFDEDESAKTIDRQPRRDGNDVKDDVESDAGQEDASGSAEAIESSYSPSETTRQKGEDSQHTEVAATGVAGEGDQCVPMEDFVAKDSAAAVHAAAAGALETEGSPDMLVSPNKNETDQQELISDGEVSGDEGYATCSGEGLEETISGIARPSATRKKGVSGNEDDEDSSGIAEELTGEPGEDVDDAGTASSADTKVVDVSPGDANVEEADETQDDMDVERSDEAPEDGEVSSGSVPNPDATGEKPAPTTTNKTISVDGHPCKTPNSGFSLSSTTIPSSAGSVDYLTETAHGAITSSAGSSAGGVASSVGIKRHLPSIDAEGSGAAGSVGSGSTGCVISSGDRTVTGAQQGGGGGKRQKVGKEKARLQEHMDRINKHYSAKKNEAAQGEGRVGPTAVLAAANAAAATLVAPLGDTESSSPAAVIPAVGSSVVPPQGTSRVIEAMVASGAATSVSTMQSSTVKKPSNLISGLHSFTSLLGNKNDQPAPMGKWDRLAAGGGATARAVPALRRAEEARALEERRARERAAARLRIAAAGAPAAAAADRRHHQPASEREGAGGASTASARADAPTRVAATANAGFNVSDLSSPGQPPLLAPLRRTGMLAKLVPGAGAANTRVEESETMLSTATAEEMSTNGDSALAGDSLLPAPFSRSTGVDAASTALATSDAAEGPLIGAGKSRAESIASATSSTSAVCSTSASDKMEMKIRDQRDQRARAQLALKRNVHMEKVKAEEAKRKAELEIKEKRDAARLEANRRAKHEAEARAREQNAQRQAEAERRRENERLEKENRDAKDRDEKEARRRKAAAEAKAKAAQDKLATTTTNSAAPSVKKSAAATGALDASTVSSSSTTSAVAPMVTAVLKPAAATAAPASKQPIAVLNPLTNRVSMSSQRIPPPEETKAVGKSAAISSTSDASAAAGAGKGTVIAAGASAVAAAAAAPVVNSYEISDKEGSDSDSDSDEEETDRKKIPTWAKGSALSEALNQQYRGDSQLDPDTIFPEVLSCDLEAIFAVKKSRYQRRGSSANWGPDRLSPHEILTYKRSVGIKRAGK